MKRYFFDLHDGIEFYSDPYGHDLDGDGRALQQAVQYLAETASDALPKTVADRKMVVNVRDADGLKVMVASIIFEVRFSLSSS